jgi:hypothetical protein
MRNLGGHRFYDPTPFRRLRYPCFPYAPGDPDFDKYFAPSGFSGVHQLKEVDAATPDTDDMFFDGIDPRVMSMFDLHVPDSDDLGELDHLLFLALHIVSPISCVCQGILPRSTTLRCVQRTPISSTASSALTLTTGPMTLGSSGPIVSFEVSIISMMLVITSTPILFLVILSPPV